MRTYKWKGRDAIPVDPQVAGDHLDKLKKRKRKKLRPDDVVEDARDPSSPIHEAFEWDDDLAAEEHRKEQARRLLRNLVVVIKPETEEEDEKVTRAYVNVVDDEQRHHYMDYEEAYKSPELREQIVRRAWQELKAFRRRYEHIAELAAVFQAMDDAEKPKKRRRRKKAG